MFHVEQFTIANDSEITNQGHRQMVKQLYVKNESGLGPR